MLPPSEADQVGPIARPQDVRVYLNAISSNSDQLMNRMLRLFVGCTCFVLNPVLFDADLSRVAVLQVVCALFQCMLHFVLTKSDALFFPQIVRTLYQCSSHLLLTVSDGILSCS
jgi:hypothetical protein